MKKSLLTLALLLVAPSASAETIARKMIRADELPYGEPAKLAPAQVQIPGAREGAAVPASWKTITSFGEMDGNPNARCFDGRTSAVEGSGGEVDTTKIFAIDGKEFVDHATLTIADGKIKVKEATRTRVMKILDSGPSVAIWGFRRQGYRGPEVVFLSAVDDGVFDRAIGYGCYIREATALLPTQSISFGSSVAAAYETAGRIWEFGTQEKKGKRPGWAGENYQVAASTSKSATDPSPMVAILLKR